MPGPSWDELPGNARAAFGAFQRAAADHLTTAGIWDSLRDFADQQAVTQLRRQGNLAPSIDEIAAQSRTNLAGWNIQAVNTARRYAGQWLRAKSNLARLAPDQVPTANEIFNPPWGAPPEGTGFLPVHNLRLQLEITNPANPDFVDRIWVTAPVEGELTSMEDMLSSYSVQALKDHYSQGGAYSIFAPNNVDITDYEIEQV